MSSNIMRKPRTPEKSIPEIGEGKRGESGHIGYLLRQAHAAHRIKMEYALKDMGLTLPQFSVLTMLAAYPRASGAELARLSLLTPQTMSVIVGNLERAEMVSRRPHEVHGRIQIIEITAAGRELLVRGKSAVQSAETALLAGVSPADEKVVRRWLVQVAKHLDGV
ncbi:MAG: MarR family winged helix-turn-helix transcriptional regulator [Rouxiella aceris]|uniref:MarR family winged helix-turn-helix transcriptional regulator n=1 Tax=Rouxiella aceris TaxID=2703884 RepID=UPI002843BB4C|nr:MarR family winged helix-turn-helix transcriptional regulator [Rouxiella aceris]MDR3434317.1 MarR family winged helix-turn-helix transcriptional regulator [Rouxiella aceris]